MALTGKLIAHVEMNSGGRVLHDLLRHNPHDIASICPHKVHGCDLVSGQRGAVGSTILWHYTHDGKQHSTKELIEEIDEANQKIVFKVIEGELVEEIYKTFKITFQVEPKQDGKQLGTWTFEFEKPNVNVPDPTSLMALSGKLIGHVEISSGGKVLHDLLRHEPNNLSSICPEKVHGCDLISGERGAVGSIILWHYTHDGKRKTAKEIIEAVDETNHTVVFKVIEGEIVEEIYTAFKLSFHVEPKQNGKQLGIWTFEFEKPNVSVPYPTSLMDYLCDLIKDMDDHACTTK
ncbi:Bet v I domain-containing protein [Cynara cardunculus var. scolymus]|uniref:Bet v I domain-containing protein n=1 Tax=Cynara cardunculus var. scolymus TaxID=59895 RepID=A0A103YAD3_CYNCS|nr:Bet v I domain-containing protein [Cynara cardunculus var. scolymus]